MKRWWRTREDPDPAQQALSEPPSSNQQDYQRMLLGQHLAYRFIPAPNRGDVEAALRFVQGPLRGHFLLSCIDIYGDICDRLSSLLQREGRTLPLAIFRFTDGQDAPIVGLVVPYATFREPGMPDSPYLYCYGVPQQWFTQEWRDRMQAFGSGEHRIEGVRFNESLPDERHANAWTTLFPGDREKKEPQSE